MDVSDLKVVETVEDDDGGLTIVFDIGPRFRSWIKGEYNWERLTRKRFEWWFLKVLGKLVV